MKSFNLKEAILPLLCLLGAGNASAYFEGNFKCEGKSEEKTIKVDGQFALRRIGGHFAHGVGRVDFLVTVQEGERLLLRSRRTGIGHDWNGYSVSYDEHNQRWQNEPGNPPVSAEFGFSNLRSYETSRIKTGNSEFSLKCAGVSLNPVPTDRDQPVCRGMRYPCQRNGVWTCCTMGSH